MEEEVKIVVENIYKSSANYIYSYNKDPSQVLKEVIRHMKVVPINIKYILRDFYEGLTTHKVDEPLKEA
jgi:hypothetical protein